MAKKFVTVLGLAVLMLGLFVPAADAHGVAFNGGVECKDLEDIPGDRHATDWVGFANHNADQVVGKGKVQTFTSSTCGTNWTPTSITMTFSYWYDDGTWPPTMCVLGGGGVVTQTSTSPFQADAPIPLAEGEFCTDGSQITNGEKIYVSFDYTVCDGINCDADGPNRSGYNSAVWHTV